MSVFRFGLLLSWLVLLFLHASGCSRGHYRLRADADAYQRVVEKARFKPWEVPSTYSVYPQANSRLHDPTCVNDPSLPNPAPQLYAYDLPELPERDVARFRPRSNEGPLQPEQIDLDQMQRDQMETEVGLEPPAPVLPTQLPAIAAPFTASNSKPSRPTTPETVTAETQRLPNPTTEESGTNLLASTEKTPQAKPSPFRSVSYPTGAERSYEELLVSQLDPTVTPLPLDPPALPVPEAASVLEQGKDLVRQIELSDIDSAADNPETEAESDDADEDESQESDNGGEASVGAGQVPLPASYWGSIPPECLRRMFAFETVREEYKRTFGSYPKEAQRDDSPKLALEDIIELTLLNSRELQTQKELLYRVALVLTLERFDYQLKPSFGNNGTATNFSNSRILGVSESNLRLPTRLQLEKMMYSGADFIGRFANDVLLTYNGPQGFAVDVGSELFFSLSQSLLQRDVRLESLTQAERNVVYAARDFARFRRELFVQQASDYYSLIRQFRQIEIQCQNYFTLAREFNQRSVEKQFGFAARTQLDQVEQQVINGRQSILNACVNLENALDNLKIRMGIPTEQPLNIDLSELNVISLRDELAVNAELIERTLERIGSEMKASERSPFLIVGGASDLAEHMLDSLRIRKTLGEESVDAGPVETRLLELAIEASDIDVAESSRQLDVQLNSEEPDVNKVIFRRRDVSKELIKKLLYQIDLLEKVESPEERMAEWKDAAATFRTRLEQTLEENQAESESETVAASRDRLLAEVEGLQEDLQAYIGELDDLLGRAAPASPEEFESRAIQYAQEAIKESSAFRDGSAGGLVPIQMDMDDAMLTALVQRFDLMNQRGDLADSWRQIKYAGDDLRSILNINASHSIRTHPGQREPFDFSSDDHSTSLGLSFDLPFNRRAQRNRYRTSLFDYQQTLRNVMQLEDTIKLSVRRDLRTLKLDRQQYANDIAGAALASERVRGTEAEVRLGVATSRDFLESQQAYVQAISGVASDHINYIVGRLDLFLDLESLSVGDDGFWEGLYDEKQQPEPNYQTPGYARPSYGELHPRLKYSRMIRRMECLPEGVPMVHKQMDPETQRLPAAEATTSE